MAEFFDLLGDPVPENFGRRGRPPHIVNDEKRKLVIQLQAFGKSDDEIAAALSVSAPTLRKHYFRELKARAESRARLDGMLLAALLREVEAGNVSAIDKYFKRLDRHDLAGFARPTKPKKLGKKEQALEDAHRADADTSWNRLVN